MAVHIAESAAETELLATGSGKFAEAWRGRGIPLPERLGKTSIEWLAGCGALSDRTLCIHAVRASHADIQLLAEAGAAVAHCPLSNQAHGHGHAPLSRFLMAGIRVGLGTDSVVSVGTLDLLAEARAAAVLASLGADEAIELCTLGGARALRLDREIGSLVTGKWADCTIIAIPGGTSNASPAEQVLSSSPADVRMTCIGGKDVYRAR